MPGMEGVFWSYFVFWPCPTARGILVPQPGIKSVESQPLGHQGSPQRESGKEVHLGSSPFPGFYVPLFSFSFIFSTVIDWPKPVPYF